MFAGLHHIAFVDRVADVERNGDAVADDSDSADDLLHTPDRLGRRGRAGLRIFVRCRRTGEQIDKVGRQRSAVWRNQRRLVLACEISGNNELVAVAADQNEIGTGAVKMRGKQKLRVRNDDVGWMDGIKINY